MGGADAPGLCASCVNARVIESSKGAIFIRCERSFIDAQFARYPRLPMMRCEGFATTEQAAQRLRIPSREAEMTEPRAEQNRSTQDREPRVPVPPKRPVPGREETPKDDQADSGPDRDHPITRGDVK
jgi:hypothetical protein